MHRVLVAGLIAWLLFVANARACDPPWLNSPPFTPERALAEAAAVFVGRVTDIEEIRQTAFEPEPIVRYTAQRYCIAFRVSEAWKGITASDVEVTTGMGGGDCGFEFQRGHEYLVVAFREEDVRGRPLVAAIYSGTAETTDADAADHLAMLRAWRPPVTFDRVVPSPAAQAVRR